MPLSRFEQGTLSGGILKDLGDALAQRLGRSARYLSVPPKRVPLMLQNGEADAVCYILPAWVPGTYHWSSPLLPGSGVLVARAEAAPVKTLAQLAGKPVGTVAGYRYKNFEAALGARFMRDDAPFMINNWQKLQAGRMQYAIMERMTVDYLLRENPAAKVRVDLEFEPIKANCAFSLKSRVPFAEADKAINAMLADGSIERILAQYR
jgi:ABC-type amino acid transport substrate-binding protein